MSAGAMGQAHKGTWMALLARRLSLRPGLLLRVWPSQWYVFFARLLPAAVGRQQLELWNAPSRLAHSTTSNLYLRQNHGRNKVGHFTTPISRLIQKLIYHIPFE